MESSKKRRSESLQAFRSQIDSGAGLHLDESFLLLSAAVSGSVDVMDCLVQMDELASNVPSPTIEGIARHLFTGSNPFRGNAEDYYNASNSLLDEVLASRLGIPITLAVLMIEIGRRLGVRMTGIGMPGHFLVGSEAPIGKVPDLFIDPFHGGEILDIGQCRQLFQRVTGGVTSFDTRYLACLHPFAILERALTNLKSIYTMNDELEKLRSVMILRSCIPGLGKSERDDFLRLMAPYN